MDHFLGSSSLSWRTNKQNPVALSIAELCVMLCITPMDKEVTLSFLVLTDTISLMSDNTSALNMAKNLVQYKRTKHIDIRHHFLRDNVDNGNILMKFCKTEDQVADVFSKALSKIILSKAC